jgi:hypothetical protein
MEPNQIGVRVLMKIIALNDEETRAEGRHNLIK